MEPIAESTCCYNCGQQLSVMNYTRRVKIYPELCDPCEDTSINQQSHSEDYQLQLDTYQLD